VSHPPFTPGPYVFLPEQGEVQSATRYRDGYPLAESIASKANGFLFAAAPDLYAACEAALPFVKRHLGALLDIGMEGSELKEEGHAIHLIVAALAKARGES